MPVRMTETDFWERTEWVPPSTCRIWTGSTIRGGYGWLGFRGKYVLAHRLAYELVKGPIPEGLDIDHLCRVRCCVNPDHLEPVTHAVNCARGIRPTRSRCRNGHKFTPDNTYNSHVGARLCKTCDREKTKRYLARRKAVQW